MQKILQATVSASLCLLVACASLAQEAADTEPSVNPAIGKQAPAFTPGKWIKGEPVEKLEKGKIYVIEFWATWYPPCRASIPHLSQLQSKYTNVIFIGQNCRERDTSAVPVFIEQMGDKMTYRVVLDDKEGTMNENWMEASGQNGIPCAFVIDKETKVAWIGHPMAVDKILDMVVAGTFDAAKWTKQENFLKVKGQKLATALQDGELENAMIIIAEIEQNDPDAGKELAFLKFGLLLKQKQVKEAIVVGKELLKVANDNADALNQLAWMLVDPDNPVDDPDLNLALKAATRATEITKKENGAILDTLARVYFMKGDLAKAIEIQTMAAEKVTDRREKSAMQDTLDEYQDKKDDLETKKPSEAK